MERDSRDLISLCAAIIAASIIYIAFMMVAGNIVLIYAAFLLVIPALILAVAFTLAHYLIPICTIRLFFFDVRGKKRHLVTVGAVAVVLGMSAFLAQQANSELERTAVKLTSGDILPEQLPAPKSMALRGRYYRDRDGCTGTCLRLLLNGQVDKVIVFTGNISMKDMPDFSSLEGTAYWLEDGQDCDPKAVDGSLHSTASRQKEDVIDPKSLLDLYMARGTCLKWRKARLDEADALLVSYTIDAGQTNTFDAGYNRLAKTFHPVRLSYVVDLSGARREAYRATHISLELHPYFLFPNFNGGSGLKMKPGFVRPRSKEVGKGIVSEERFLTEMLNMKLAIKGEDIIRIQRQLIQAALQGKRPVDDVIASIVEKYTEIVFDPLRSKREINPNKEDLEILIKITNNEKIFPYININSISRYINNEKNNEIVNIVIKNSIRISKKYIINNEDSNLEKAFRFVTIFSPEDISKIYMDEIGKIYKEILKSPCMTISTLKYISESSRFPPSFLKPYAAKIILRAFKENYKKEKIECVSGNENINIKREYMIKVLREICKIGKSAQDSLPLIQSLDIDKEDYNLIKLKIATMRRLGMKAEEIKKFYKNDIESHESIKRNIDYILSGNIHRCE